MRFFTRLIAAFALLMGTQLAANGQNVQITNFPGTESVYYWDQKVLLTWTGTDTVSCLRVLPSHAGTIQQGSPTYGAEFFLSLDDGATFSPVFVYYSYHNTSAYSLSDSSVSIKLPLISTKKARIKVRACSDTTRFAISSVFEIRKPTAKFTPDLAGKQVLRGLESSIWVKFLDTGICYNYPYFNVRNAYSLYFSSDGGLTYTEFDQWNLFPHYYPDYSCVGNQYRYDSLIFYVDNIPATTQARLKLVSYFSPLVYAESPIFTIRPYAVSFTNPTATEVVPGCSSSYTLNWTAEKDPKFGFKFLFQANPGASWQDVGSSPASARSASITLPPLNTTHARLVLDYRRSDSAYYPNTDTSSVFTVRSGADTLTITSPLQPIKTATSTPVLITWRGRPSAGGYKIQRQLVPNNDYYNYDPANGAWTTVARLPGTATSYTYTTYPETWVQRVRILDTSTSCRVVQTVDISAARPRYINLLEGPNTNQVVPTAGQLSLTLDYTLMGTTSAPTWDFVYELSLDNGSTWKEFFRQPIAVRGDTAVHLHNRYNWFLSPFLPASSQAIVRVRSLNDPRFVALSKVFSTSAPISSISAGSNDTYSLKTGSFNLTPIPSYFIGNNLPSYLISPYSGLYGSDLVSGVWSLVSGPGPVEFILSSPIFYGPTFYLSNSFGLGNLKPGTYNFRYTLTDVYGNVKTADVSYTLQGVPGHAPPIISVGPDFTIAATASPIVLVATETPADSIVNRQWTFGPGVGPNFISISNGGHETAQAAGFTLPGDYYLTYSVTTKDGFYVARVLKITVTDGSLPDSISAGPDKVITLPSTSVTLNGFARFASPTTTQWAQISGPATASIASPAALITAISGLTQTGIYRFRLQGGSLADTAEVSVLAQPDSLSAGPDKLIVLPTTTVSITGFARFASPTSTQWSQISGPATASIVSPSLLSTAINGLTQAGTYRFRLQGGRLADTILVTVQPEPTATSIYAGADEGWGLPFVGTVLHGSVTPLVSTRWTQLSGPVAIRLADPSRLSLYLAGFTQVGVYAFELRAGALADTVNIIVKPGFTLKSFSPTSASKGGTVTIKGKNLGTIGLVYFGSTAAQSFTQPNDSTLVAVVGNGSTGSVYVASSLTSSSIGGAILDGFRFVTTTITSFSPVQGPVGERVRIRGTQLSLANAVYFNGIAATQWAASGDTVITALVPAGATTGGIAVTVAGSSTFINSSYYFLITDYLSLFGFMPGSGAIADTVYLYGRRMSLQNGVRFNGALASYTRVVGDTIIKAVVPNGATTGKINITSTQGTSLLSSTNFTIALPPTITSFSPGSGPVGERVRVRGQRLSQVRGVYFGNVQATNWAASGDTLITAIVPTGAINARIGVVNRLPQPATPVFTAQSGPYFNILFGPVIRSLAPSSGHVGDTVLVIGRRLSTTIQVRFNNNALQAKYFKVITDTSVKTVVPTGTTTGLVRVIVASFSLANSPNPFVVAGAAPFARLDIGNEPTISLYPNPAREEVQVQVLGDNALLDTPLLLRDLQGRVVKTFPALATQETRSLSLYSVAKGVYSLHIGYSHQRLIVE